VPEQLSKTIETLYRSESGRILATLVHLLGDLDLAEEAMHEAFAAALDTWPQTGTPENRRPWLISTARFKAIDAMRQRARFDAAERDLALRLEARINEASHEDEEIEDDRLRLIFTCSPIPFFRRKDRLRSPCAKSVARQQRRLLGHFSLRRRRSRSASCAQRPSSAIRQFLTRCPTCRNCRPGWEPSSRWCI
jgi:hypothetical protein